jgi:hypothetical protein
MCSDIQRVRKAWGSEYESFHVEGVMAAGDLGHGAPQQYR